MACTAILGGWSTIGCREWLTRGMIEPEWNVDRLHIINYEYCNTKICMLGMIQCETRTGVYPV